MSLSMEVVETQGGDDASSDGEDAAVVEREPLVGRNSESTLHELDGLSLESFDNMSLSSMGEDDGHMTKPVSTGPGSGHTRSSEGSAGFEQLLRDRYILSRAAAHCSVLSLVPARVRNSCGRVLNAAAFPLLQ